MELRHLRHFVAVAEELHFGRAAARLGIAQSALSQSLRRLEANIGVQLLERTRRQVRLTPPGGVLLEQARPLLAHSERCAQQTRRAAAGVVSRLHIGYSTSALFDALPRCLKGFMQRWPAVDVSMREYPVGEQVAALFSGSLDVAFMSHHGPAVAGLEMVVIERQDIVAAVPSDSPLAGRKSVRLRELSGYPLLTSELGSMRQLDSAIAAAWRHGEYNPKRVHHAGQAQALLSLVANDIGIAFVPQRAGRLHMEGVALLRVSDFPDEVYLETVVAWMPEAESATLKLFLAEVRRNLKPALKTPVRTAASSGVRSMAKRAGRRPA
jgi:DNA-binding transcriptional LysR family regulator